jgi:hypothetical protein
VTSIVVGPVVVHQFLSHLNSDDNGFELGEIEDI